MKWCKRLLWAAVVVVTLWVLLVQVANWRGAGAWARAQERLVEEGELWTLEALAPGAVPDGKNFFGTEALSGINRDGDDDAGGRYAEKRERLESMFPLKSVEGFEVPEEDKVGRRWGGARPYPSLLAYVNAAGTLETAGGEVGDGESARVFGEALEAAHGALFEELEAAVDREYSRIESNYLALEEGEMLFSVSVPHYLSLRALSETLQLRAGLAAVAGDSRRARSSVAVMLRLAEAAGEEPVLIGQLVARSIEMMAFDAVWEGLEAGCFSDADLSWFQAAFGEIDVEKGYLTAMRGELLAGLDAMDVFSEGGAERQLMLSLGVTAAAEAGVALAPGGWIDQNRATLVNWSLDYQILPLKRGGLPALIEAGEALEKVMIKAKEGVMSLPHTVIPSLILPVTDSVGRLMQWHVAVRELCVTACALERFRLAEGRYPDRLEELVERFSDAVPADPQASGAPGYRREGEGFRLWAIGLDGEDDGGEAGVASERKSEFDGDWVWVQRSGG